MAVIRAESPALKSAHVAVEHQHQNQRRTSEHHAFARPSNPPAAMLPIAVSLIAYAVFPF